MSVIRCACALLVTPYTLHIDNNWPTVVLRHTTPDQAFEICYHFGTGSTSTSQPFEVGIPVPSVLPPMSLQVGGP